MAMQPSDPFAMLTKRERQVLQLIAGQFMSNKEVGRHLRISSRTVEVHRARTMEKLGALNIAHLVTIYSNLAQTNLGETAVVYSGTKLDLTLGEPVTLTFKRTIDALRAIGATPINGTDQIVRRTSLDSKGRFGTVAPMPSPQRRSGRNGTPL